MAADGFITVTPIAGNALHFQAMSGEEELNRPFRYVVDVLSRSPDLALAQALGERMTVTVRQTESGARCFNGFVTCFSRTGTAGRYFVYRAVLHPWLWFLGNTSDCRIFRHKTVPEIVKSIFRKHSTSAFRERLENAREDYPKREHTVQYRETDLSFVNRLLEEAGITYHFVHDGKAHTLVLTDSISGREARDGYAAVSLRAPARADEGECLMTWQATEDIKPAGYALRDFDPLNAGASLRAQLMPGEDRLRKLTGELYDFPGGYLSQDGGDRIVKLRLNEAQSLYGTVQTSGPVRGLGAGQVFKVLEGPLRDRDTQHLIVKAAYELRGHDPESGGGESGHDRFACELTLIDAQTPFRPARRTPKPLVHGPQTAIVVGPDETDGGADVGGDPGEIWTDDHGRVLVRFHWERAREDPRREHEPPEDDEPAPCFVRVASPWAGKQWGVQFTPRIGQEVVVEFLDGDPDRPIVTGRLYNNLNRPPYANAKRTQSGIKTQTINGGGPGNGNEIRFDDQKGAEELFIQAERDQRINVKGNRCLRVGGDETILVAGSRATTVASKDTVTLQDEHSVTVSKLFHMESAEKILLTVGASTITITPDRIDLAATSITLNGGAAVEILGGVIKLNG